MLQTWKAAIRVATRFLLSRKAKYTAAFLTPSSRSELLRWWHTTVGPTLDEDVADHMTITFEPSEQDIASILAGERVQLHVIGYAQDERGQAVLVRPSGLDAKLKDNPHVTVSITHGTGAKYSNELLARGPIHRVHGPTLEAKLDIKYY